MGNLIWHDWAHFLALTASVYTTWAGYWGIFYRKFFWDFVTGIVRTPGGIQPSNQDAIFVTLIVKAPIIQILAMLSGLGMIALEFPLPFLKGTAIHRSLVIRVVWLLVQAVLAVLFYQGTNGALWSLIAAMAYGRALALGETMEEAKANRGKESAA